MRSVLPNFPPHCDPRKKTESGSTVPPYQPWTSSNPSLPLFSPPPNVWIYPIKDFHLSPTHRPLGVVGFLVILTRLVCHLKVLLQYIKGLYMLTQTIPITGLFLQALGKIPLLTLQLQLFHLLLHLKDLWCLKLLAM